MNRAQRLVLILYCLLLAYCCVWVPWHLVQGPNSVRSGYGWLWTGPKLYQADIPPHALSPSHGYASLADIQNDQQTGTASIDDIVEAPSQAQQQADAAIQTVPRPSIPVMPQPNAHLDDVPETAETVCQQDSPAKPLPSYCYDSRAIPDLQLLALRFVAVTAVGLAAFLLSGIPAKSATQN